MPKKELPEAGLLTIRTPPVKRIKYEKPIASRELIMQLLNEQGEPLTKRWQLERPCWRLMIKMQSEALRRRLRAMERDGQLMRNRKAQYVLLSKLDLMSGRMQGHRDGFGFLIPDEGRAMIFSCPPVKCVRYLMAIKRWYGLPVKIVKAGQKVLSLKCWSAILISWSGAYQGSGSFGYMSA